MSYLRGIAILKVKEKKKCCKKGRKVITKQYATQLLTKVKQMKKETADGCALSTEEKEQHSIAIPKSSFVCHGVLQGIDSAKLFSCVTRHLQEALGEARLSVLHSGIFFESRYSRGTQNFHGSNQFNPRCERSCSSSHSRHVPIFSQETQLRDKKMTVIR